MKECHYSNLYQKTETFKPFVSEQLSLELEDVDYTPLDVIYDYSSLQEDNKSKKRKNK